MAKRFPWFRFYHEALNDRKIQRAVRMSQQPKALIMGVWLTLLCLANDSPERGKLMISDDMWLEEDEIIAETGLDPVTFGKVITAFQKLNMVSVSAGYEVLNWQKRQYASDDSTVRVQKHRAKKQAEHGETLQKRYSHVIDTEKEEEKEREEEEDVPRRLVDLWQDVTGIWPGDLREPVLQERLGSEPDEKRLRLAWRLWNGKGYSPRNLDGVCDWYSNLEHDPTWRPDGRNFNGPSAAASPIIQEITQQIQTVGSYKSPELSETAAKVVHLAGGWSTVCGMQSYQLDKALAESYQEVAGK